MSRVTVISSNGRLSQDGYKRPKKTITESIQNEEDIQDRLKDYREITQKELCVIPQNSHLRYLKYDKRSKKELFRFGGILINVKDQYVILAGVGGKTFSAQRYTYDDKGKVIHETRFFKKLTDKELMQKKLESTITYSNDVFKKQQLALEQQQKEIEKLKRMLKKQGK
jgi:hypothetical protein